MAFTTIPASAVDADSPLDSILFGYVKDNFDYLKGLFNTSTGHKHDGTTDAGGPVTPADGSVTTVKLVDANVTLAKLKFTQGSYGAAIATGTGYITIAQYAHYPHLTLTSNIGGSSAYLDCKGQDTTGNATIRQVAVVGTYVSGGNYTVYWDYHSN